MSNRRKQSRRAAELANLKAQVRALETALVRADKALEEQAGLPAVSDDSLVEELSRRGLRLVLSPKNHRAILEHPFARDDEAFAVREEYAPLGASDLATMRPFEVGGLQQLVINTPDGRVPIMADQHEHPDAIVVRVHGGERVVYDTSAALSGVVSWDGVEQALFQARSIRGTTDGLTVHVRPEALRMLRSDALAVAGRFGAPPVTQLGAQALADSINAPPRTIANVDRDARVITITTGHGAGTTYRVVDATGEDVPPPPRPRPYRAPPRRLDGRRVR